MQGNQKDETRTGNEEKRHAEDHSPGDVAPEQSGSESDALLGAVKGVSIQALQGKSLQEKSLQEKASQEKASQEQQLRIMRPVSVSSATSKAEEIFTLGSRVMGGGWKFVLVVAVMTAVAAANAFILNGSLDTVLFVTTILLGVIVLLKMLKDR